MVGTGVQEAVVGTGVQEVVVGTGVQGAVSLVASSKG